MNLGARQIMINSSRSYPWDYRVAYIEKASGDAYSGGIFTSRYMLFGRFDDSWSCTYSIKNNLNRDCRVAGDCDKSPYVGALSNKYRFGYNSWNEISQTVSNLVVTYEKANQIDGKVYFYNTANKTSKTILSNNGNTSFYHDMIEDFSDPVQTTTHKSYIYLFGAMYGYTYGDINSTHAYPYAYQGTRIYDYLYITQHDEYAQYNIKSQHLIPCVYQGQPTFYDELNNVFCEQITSGSFIAGPQVKDDGSDIIYT